MGQLRPHGARVVLGPVAIATGAAVAAGSPWTLGIAALLAISLLTLIAQLERRAVFIAALTWTVIPQFRVVPTGLTLWGHSVYFSDLLLPVGIGIALVGSRWRPKGVEAASALFLVAYLVYGALVAVARGNETTFLLRDVRPVTYTLIAFVGVLSCFEVRHQRAALRGVAVLLSVTALVVLTESITGWDVLGGRVEQVDPVQSSIGDNSLGATRFLVAPKDLAIVCMCMSLCALLYLPKRPRSWSFRTISVAASVIVLFSFSRRAVLALVVAIVIGAILLGSFSLVLRLASLLVGVMLVVAAIAALHISAGGYMGQQIRAYEGRVITGLSSDARAADAGLAWRGTEDRFAVVEIEQAPVTGTGFGGRYRPFVQGEPFGPTFQEHDYGRTYIHDFYLGVMVKTGYVGLGLWCAFLAIPVLLLARRWRRVEPSGALLLAGLGGLLSVNVFSPVVTESATSLVFGAMIGLMFRLPKGSPTRQRTGKALEDNYPVAV